MDWITEHLSKIFQAIFWENLLARFQWVDWFSVAFAFFGMVYGIRKGLMRELVETAELILVIFLVYAYLPTINTFLTTHVAFLSPRMNPPTAFISSGLLFWLMVRFIDGYLQKTVHANVAGFVRGFGGAAVGVVHFLLVWSFISQALILMPLPFFHKMYESGHSVSGEEIKNVIPEIYKRLASPAKSLPAAKG